MSYVFTLGLVAAGVLAAAQGGALIVLGILLIAAGGFVAVGLKSQVDEARAARAEWEASRWCVACDRRLPPGWRPPTEAA
ncbi:hypothetical protein RM844_30160 [Streptomyces sp. DSM 44915]|uniref:Uncharacterized protein n=1 Tax=Streptomyces chisholmiae TaxID=3075540 RepID=A0ABU2K028_9ACTN|nr:hypothetical protein [Streptomyces sp. DSM 44915]MDT0270545.1 hypothetical protein [Streptomyces sp. DSM 44915]